MNNFEERNNESGSFDHALFSKREKCRCTKLFAKRAIFLFACGFFKLLIFESSISSERLFQTKDIIF